jgi:hypothetical protein
MGPVIEAASLNWVFGDFSTGYRQNGQTLELIEATEDSLC